MVTFKSEDTIFVEFLRNDRCKNVAFLLKKFFCKMEESRYCD